MNNQKIENLLNLAISSTEEERMRSANLSAGFSASENTWEIIVKYTGDLKRIRQIAESATELFGGFSVLRVKENRLDELAQLPEVTFIEKPKPLYFALSEALEAACFESVQMETAGLSGKGVLFCCVDSGIHYTHPDFRNPDGTTRILYLWDQSVEGNPPEGYFRGTEYTREVINRALLSGTMSEAGQIVPSVDVSGHGTGVLGIGAGNGRGSGGRLRGAAYEADLIVVKLGQPGENGFPRTTELMEGVDYCIRKSVELSMPAAVNLSFGNNYGAHNGTGLLEIYLDTVAGIGKNVICVGMGNEGVSGNHVSLVLTETEPVVTEFSVGEFQPGINLQLWKAYGDEVRISLENPAGISTGFFQERLGAQRLLLPDAEILVYYGMPTPYSVQQEIYMDLIPKGSYLSEGIWKLRIEPVRIVENLAQLWLPVEQTLNGRTGFLSPTPAGSFTVPAPARNVISVAAYDSRTDAYAEFSGRAFQVLPWAGKPDLAAPGVEIQVPGAEGYRVVSGTSFATPFVTGAAALLMEWGIVRGNDPFLYGNKVKAYLRKGARRLPGFTEVPNAQAGWGALCVRDSLPE